MVAAWAGREMEAVDLNDSRLDARIAVLLSDLGSHPNLSIPAACKGRAETQAAYRLFDNDGVTFDNVLAPHARRTLQRVAGHETVLLVQDSTEIDLTRPGPDVAGAGRPAGRVTPGDPVAPAARVHARRDALGHRVGPVRQPRRGAGPGDAETADAAAEAHADRRETEHAVARGAEAEPRHRRTVAADPDRLRGRRRADIYELFAEPRGKPGGPMADWLVRACQDRALDPAGPDDEHRRLLATVSAHAGAVRGAAAGPRARRPRWRRTRAGGVSRASRVRRRCGSGPRR